jgi:hypothetical protein
MMCFNNRVRSLITPQGFSKETHKFLAIHYTGCDPPLVPFIRHEPKEGIHRTTAASPEVILELETGSDGKSRLSFNRFESGTSAFRFGFKDEKGIKHVGIWEGTVPEVLD